MNSVKFQEINVELFEEIYQELCEKEWEADNEPDFPLCYKAEFLLIFSFLFHQFGGYTRVNNTQGTFKRLYERNLNDGFVAFMYILTLDGNPFQFYSLFAKNAIEYLGMIQKLIDQYKFNQEIYTKFEFLKAKIL